MDIMFVDIKTEKQKFHYSKYLININQVGIDEINNIEQGFLR